MHKKTILILLPLILVLIAASFLLDKNMLVKKVVPAKVVGDDTVALKTVETDVSYLIQAKNFQSLSEFVDETAGLDLVPYYSSNSEQGRHLSKTEVSSFFSDVAESTWGIADGSGAPILMTNEDYYKKFIYSQDFITLGSLTENKSSVQSNTPALDTVLSEKYGVNTVKYVEYYISGLNPQYEGMDWQSLVLVFKKININWKLVGIFHGQWTI